MASPMRGWWSSTTVATSPSVKGRRRDVSSMATLARSFGSMIGRLCWMPRRWLGVSMNPPVPGVDASRNVSGDTHSALPVERMTCSQRDALVAQLLRVDLDLELPLPLAPDRHVGHAGHREQPRTDRPVARARRSGSE